MVPVEPSAKRNSADTASSWPRARVACASSAASSIDTPTCWPLPLVSRADEHVTMDFIDRVLPPILLRLLVRLMHAACAGLMFFLAWQVWIKAGKIAGYGDTTDVLRIAVAPFVYFMTVMIGLTGLVHVYKTFVPGEASASQATT